MGFRPYSLRRGGATYWFQRHQNLDRILLQGRWHTQKSARIYLNEGLAVLAQLKVPRTDSRLKPFLTVYNNFLIRPKVSTLEPPSKGGRTGGRGKGNNKSMKARKKRSFSFGADRTPSHHRRATRRCGSFDGGVARAYPFTQGVAGCPERSFPRQGSRVSVCSVCCVPFITFSDKNAAKWTKRSSLCIFIYRHTYL